MYVTVEDKPDQPHEQSVADKRVCRWCDRVLGSVTDESACPSCYKFLIGANLSDEEIFDR